MRHLSHACGRYPDSASVIENRVSPFPHVRVTSVSCANSIAVIPACAGDINCAPPKIPLRTVDPARVGDVSSTCARSLRGMVDPAYAGDVCSACLDHPDATVHPRACGRYGFLVPREHIHSGSSLRVREASISGRRHDGCDRFIPARAGGIEDPSGREGRTQVHPRMCGRHALYEDLRLKAYGSSLRVWVMSLRICPHALAGRFIPACAGDIPGSCRE